MSLNLSNLIEYNNNSNINTILSSNGSYYVLITPKDQSSTYTTNVVAKLPLYNTGFYLVGGGGGGAGAKSPGDSNGYCSGAAQGSGDKANGGGGGGGSQIFSIYTSDSKTILPLDSTLQITSGTKGSGGTGREPNGDSTVACFGGTGGRSSIKIIPKSNTDPWGKEWGDMPVTYFSNGGEGGNTETNKSGNPLGRGGNVVITKPSSSTSYPQTNDQTANGANANSTANVNGNNGTNLMVYNQIPSELNTFINSNWKTLKITTGDATIYPSTNGDTYAFGTISTSSPVNILSNPSLSGAGSSGANGGKHNFDSAGGGGFYSYRGNNNFGRKIGVTESKFRSGNNAPWGGLTQPTYAGEGGGGGTAGSNFNHAGGAGSPGSAFFYFTVKPPSLSPNPPVFNVNNKPNREITTTENITEPQNYSLTTIISPVATNGTASINDTQISYTPNLNYTSTDTFSFTSTSESGLYVSATLNITDDTFIFYNQPTSSSKDITLIGDLPYTFVITSLFDSDISGDIYNRDLSSNTTGFNVVSGPSNGSLIINSVTPNTNNYSIEYNLTYTSNPGYVGTDSIEYNIIDKETYSNGNPRTIITNNNGTSENYTISFTIKDPAIAYDLSAYVLEDISGIIDLSGIDLDDFYPLKYFLSSNVSNGILRDNTGTILNITDSSYIGIQDSSNSSPPTVSYLGNLNYNGYDNFEYFLLDNQTFTSNTAVVDISIAPVNDPPVAIDKNYFIFANDTALTYKYPTDLSGYDVDNSLNTLQFVITSAPDVGFLLDGDISLNSSNLPYNLPIGSYDISYEPTSYYVGEVEFDFYIEDPGDLSSNLGTVKIYCKPWASDLNVQVDRNEELQINFLATGIYSYSSVITTYPTHGILYTESGDKIEVNVPFDGLKSIYRPTLYYYGNDSFNYQVQFIDTITQTLLYSNKASVDISINFVNLPPYLPNQSFNFYVKQEPEIFDLSIVYFNYNGPDISNTIKVLSVPNFNIYNQPVITTWPGFIYDSSSIPLQVGDIIVNNNSPQMSILEYKIGVEFNWPGNQYIGTSEFMLQAIDNSGNKTSTGTITVNFIYDKLDGCDTGPGPEPANLWTQGSRDCPDIDGVGENDQPTSGGYNLSEKRKAEIFQYKNNNINMSSKQLYSRLARGIGRQRGSTFATQSDSYTNANTKKLQNVNVNTGPLLCPNSRVISAYTSQNNTPGPKMLITNYPNAPLYNYRVRRTYSAGNTKWPQYGPNTGQPRDPKLAGNSGSKPGYQSGNQ